MGETRLTKHEHDLLLAGAAQEGAQLVVVLTDAVADDDDELPQVARREGRLARPCRVLGLGELGERALDKEAHVGRLLLERELADEGRAGLV